MSNKTVKIGFIGGGNMAAAMIGGMVGKFVPGENIHVIDPNADTLRALSGRFGITGNTEIDEPVHSCDVIILAVKPQQIHEVTGQLLPFMGQQLILSVAAGIRASDLSRWLNAHPAIVRTMPNTPSLIGKGMTGLYALSTVSQQQKELAETIMQAVGKTVWVEEEKALDAVTAISGSGPAYVFYFIEALEAAGVQLGLSVEQARKLALETFAGATELAVQSPESAARLRERVTSPNGTTHAALSVMQLKQVDQIIIEAARAAHSRSEALGNEFSSEPGSR